LVKQIYPQIKIVIIDNASEKFFYRNIGSPKNVKVIQPNFNTGQVGGINIGFNKIKTKYLLYMDPDVFFKKTIIKKFLDKAKKIKDFIILAPQHEKSFYKKDFISTKKSKIRDGILMKLVHGHFLFFNMKDVRKVGNYDKKIWMYYDETDYCLRAYRKNKKIYVIPKFKVIHKGGSSIKSGKTLKIESHHKWHYMWSKFYFFKKNYGLYAAYKQTMGDLIINLLKFTIFFFIDNRKRVIYYNALSGLINSYINNKSHKRP
jgi:GT2 family glycosyltransferase